MIIRTCKTMHRFIFYNVSIAKLTCRINYFIRLVHRNFSLNAISSKKKHWLSFFRPCNKQRKKKKFKIIKFSVKKKRQKYCNQLIAISAFHSPCHNDCHQNEWSNAKRRWQRHIQSKKIQHAQRITIHLLCNGLNEYQHKYINCPSAKNSTIFLFLSLIFVYVG